MRIMSLQIWAMTSGKQGSLTEQWTTQTLSCTQMSTEAEVMVRLRTMSLLLQVTEV